MPFKIHVGDKAPAFSGRNAEGEVISSDSLRGHPYVLYFYPKDDTPGCTLQACSFRDTKVQMDQLDVQLIGVSPDSLDSHTKFMHKYGLNFTLLSDEDHRISQAFDVWKERIAGNASTMGILRSTFIIDSEGVICWIERPVNVEGHADRVIQALKHLKDGQ